MNKETKEIKRILAPLDGSPAAECTLNYVRTVARGLQVSNVDLMFVVEPICMKFSCDWATGECIERLDSLKEWGNKYLSQKAEELHQDGISARYMVREGNPADIIIDYAANNNIDLVVMSTHGKSGFLRYTMGSVADKVTHYSTVPVLITLPRGCKTQEQPQNMAA